MSLRVNTNVAAMNAYRNLTTTEAGQSKSPREALLGLCASTGPPTTPPAPSTASPCGRQVNGLKVATRNAQDGISVTQTAEGALNEVTTILQRMRDLSVQRANTGSNSGTAESAIDAEYSALTSEIERIGTSTKFNGNTLLDGGFTPRPSRSAAPQRRDRRRSTLDADGTNLGSPDAVCGAEADQHPDRRRRHLGRLHRPRLARCVPEPHGAHHRQPRRGGGEPVRVGVAASATPTGHGDDRFSTSQILSQAGTAMLAQANQSSQGVLSLLR